MVFLMLFLFFAQQQYATTDDGRRIVLNDDGTLPVIRASSSQYEELGSFSAINEGRDSWGPIAIAGGRMLLRDSTRMVCLGLD